LDVGALLKELSEASGISGYEVQVREAVAVALRPHVDELRSDVLGNLIGLKRGTGAEPRHKVMLAGHMDEIGLIVTQIEKGFLHFTEVGGFDVRILPGQEVLVHSSPPLPGVVASRPPHVLSPEERTKVPRMDDLLIDVGLSPAEVAAQVHVGDPVTLRAPYTELRNERVAGKSFDDRASVVAIVACMEELSRLQHTWDVYAVATVQEEVGFRGAITSTFGIFPDVGIALDVTHGDMPGVPDVDTLELGKGPSITLGPNIHPKVYEALVETARRYEIPHQIEPTPGPTGTDAWAMQICQSGVPTGLLSVPARYMHNPVETLELGDIRRAGRLLALTIARLDEVDLSR
jgi:putative aminopeptidase FrvX